jgi:hypothetical protein
MPGSSAQHGARLSLKSGVPAHAACGGVLVTLRRPHDLAPNDVLAFTRYANSYPPFENSLRPRPFEAVLALALPKRFLFAAAGFESDPCLRVLPARLLAAYAPPYFTAVLDPAPWVAGCLLLPPSAITKAYQLVPSSCLASGPGPRGKLGRGAEAGAEFASEAATATERDAMQTLAQTLQLKNDAGTGDDSKDAEKVKPKKSAPARKASLRLTVFGGERPAELLMAQPMLLAEPPAWCPEDDEDGLPYPDLEAAAKKKSLLMSKLKLAGLKAGRLSLSLASVSTAAKATAEPPMQRLKRKQSVSQRLHTSFFRAEKVLDSVANHIFHHYADHPDGLEVPKTVADFCKRCAQWLRHL